MNVLLLVHPGTNSRSTLLDIRIGFEQAGHRTFVWETGPQINAAAANASLAQSLIAAFTRSFESFLSANAIDFCLSMWGNGAMTFMCDLDPTGRVRSTFDRTRVPLVCYWLDAPFWTHEGHVPELLMKREGQVLRSPNLLHVINNPGTADEMSRVLNLNNVIALHYGVDPAAFSPRRVDGQLPEFDVVFSYGPGDPDPTPLMLDQLEADVPNVHALRQSEAQRVQALLFRQVDRWPGPHRDAAISLLNLLVTLQLQRRDVPMLTRIEGVHQSAPHLASAIEHLYADLRLYTDITAALRTIEQWERAFTFSYLSRHFNCATFGTGDPARWRCRTTHLGPVDWDQQAAVYSRGWFGLNVMRWQDDVGLNVKPFEITASGAALLCARRGGLDQLFTPGAECLAFDSPAEARTLARAALADPPRLAALAAAGRDRTLANATWKHVAQRIVEHTSQVITQARQASR